MKTILFGNRGSRPLGASPDSPFERYGGDTTALGVICDDGTLVAFDTGSGFWKWPYTLEKILDHPPPHKLNVFYTHYHDDHTSGIAQSKFLFQAAAGQANSFDFYGPDFTPGLQAVFANVASRPRNPDLLHAYAAQRTFHMLAEADPVHEVRLSDAVKISWMTVPHGAEKSLAYRVDQANGQSFCFISDTHHYLDADGRPVLDPAIVAFIRGSEALIYDSQFSDAEFNRDPAFLGGAMGHSTGEHGVRLAAAAGVPLLVKHHHDPDKIDEVLDAETAALRAYGAARGVDVVAARPSLCLDLSLPDEAARLAFIERQKNPRNDAYTAIRGPAAG